MVKIIQKENKILRKSANKVPLLEITSPKIKKVLLDMKTALVSEPDGVAIAAPQIGLSLRIFVVAGKVFSLAKKRSQELSPVSHSVDNSVDKKLKPFGDMAFINPELVKISKDKGWMEEGCLSVRHFYGRVERAKKVRVRAYDEKGKVFELGGSGLLAQIFQHEIDHLNGTLFIDKAKDVVELDPDDYEK